MTGAFTVQSDSRRHILRITMSGFFSSAQIADLRTAVAQALVLLGCAPGQHLSLVDIRDMDIQSQDAVGRFAQLLSTPEVRSRRIAFIVARSLARLQVQRAAGQRDARYFEDGASAEAWLIGEAASVGYGTAIAS